MPRDVVFCRLGGFRPTRSASVLAGLHYSCQVYSPASQLVKSRRAIRCSINGTSDATRGGKVTDERHKPIRDARKYAAGR